MIDGPTQNFTRRNVLAKLGAGMGVLLSPPARASSHTEIANGRVYEDVDGRGTCGRFVPGIEGVMVSNGRDVTLTRSDGTWSLPVRHGDTIFVIKPPHWAIAQNSFCPAGYYLHQPQGTPLNLGLATPSVAPTGPLPSSIDFSLVRRREPDAFEALLVADTQAANAVELSYARADLLSCVASTKPAFAIHHGDVMGDDLRLFSAHIGITAETGIPWYHCPGNHDMNLDSPVHEHAFEAWKATIGPTNSAFQYAGATFILLNNVEYYGRGSRQRIGRGYRGYIGDEQLQFVANVLRNVSEDQLIVVSMHIPLVSFETPDSISDTTADRNALLKLLSGRKHTVSFAGHSHTTEHHYLGSDNGFDRATPHHHHVLTAACGSWWSGPCDARGIPLAESRDGSPKGIHVLSVEGNRYKTRLVASPSARQTPMRIMVCNLSGEQTGYSSAGSHLLVDVFDGGPRTRVSMEIGGVTTGAVALQNTVMEDPHIVEHYARHKALCKPWVAPALSSHIWTAPLPAGLSSSPFNVVIRVESEYGHVHVERQTLVASA
jgi:hypothetical protein